MHTPSFRIFLWLLLAFTGLFSHAQQLASVPAAQPDISEIKLNFSGPQKIDRDAVLAHVSLRVGMPYDQQMLDQSIRSLYETGLYDFVGSSRQTQPDGSVVLQLDLVPKFRVSAVIFKGNQARESSRLQREIQTKAGGVLDPVQVSRDASKLYEFYEKRGYSKVAISSDIERNEVNGTAVVTFNIVEGPRILIERIDFAGNGAVKPNVLRKEIKTARYQWWSSWFTDTGYFINNEFDADLDKLAAYYRNLGYLDVTVLPENVVFEYPKPDRMIIIIKIDEGRQYKVGNITISGNTIFQTPDLMKELTMKQGDVFSPAVLDKNTEALRDFYGQVGYLDTYVRAERKANLETGDIDVNFAVVESEKFFVESINIQGNDKTKSVVILRELALAPGDVFDLTRMRISEARVRNTRYFDEVNLAPEATNIPGRRNLRISLREARTGNLTFGAGFSTVEKLVAYAEFTQGNFDLFNMRNGFQGAGQKFRVRLAIGTETNQILVSFEEPWMFQRELGFEWNGYRTEADYYADYYNETRLGTSFFFRKRIVELLEGRVGYTVENINVSNIQSNAPPDVFACAGNQSLSKVSFTLLRDDRDQLIFPTKGTRFELTNELAGGPLMGEISYYKIEGRAGWWTVLFGDDAHVLQVLARAGSMMPNDGATNIPYTERFFLGGAYNMRGYGYRDVGPYQSDPLLSGYGAPLGGATFVYFSPEYTIRIFEQLRFAMFYDFGYLNSGDWDFNPDNYNHDIGVGFRILIMGAPLRLDLGYPLNPNQFQSNSIQFNFSFGTAF